MNKVELRKIMRNLPIDPLSLVSQQNYLLKKLDEELRLRNPTCVGLFSPLVNEINLNSIFANIKAIAAYPKINGNTLTFHEVTSLNELNLTLPYGICEPFYSAELITPDIVIVPGLAFSKDGHRLGRGKGHYDRYLSANPTFAISLAFSWQLLEKIPTEPHDVLIDKVLWAK